MLYSEDIKPISFLKNKTADIIKKVSETKRAVIITQNGEAKAVVQDIKSYENLQNSLAMLKMIIQSENDIENGDIIEQEKIFTDLDKELFN